MNNPSDTQGIANRAAPSIGWWSAEPQQLTGQTIITSRVAALLARANAIAFLYHGNGFHSVASWAKSTGRLAWSLFRGQLNLLYLVCSRSSFGFIRDLPAYCAVFSNVQVIVHVHGSDIVDLCQRPWLGRLARILLARCEIVVPSVHLLSPLQKLGIPKVHLCENFAELPDTPCDISQSSLTKNKPAPWRVLWNSNIMASKGFFAVASAVRCMAHDGMPIMLIALGRPIGDEMMSLHACDTELKRLRGEPWFQYLGPVDRTTMMQKLQEADAVCLPSHYSSECQPLALIEAMYAGRAILIADTPALRATAGAYPYEMVTVTTTEAVKSSLQYMYYSPLTKDALHSAAEFARQRFSALRFEQDMARLLGIHQMIP